MKIKEVIPEYINHLTILGLSRHTIKNTRYALRNLTRFLEKEDVYEIEDLTKGILSDYQEDLAFYMTPKGRLMGIESQAKLLSSVRGFSRFLKQKDYLLNDPGEIIKLPKIPKRLPKVILSTKEMERILNAPDMRTHRGYRDRVILEILYDTAIRRSEILNIKLTDLDLNSGYIRIHGKGDKERIVPVSEQVCTLIRNYILFIRQSFVKEHDSGYLIPGRFGERMDAGSIGEIVKRWSSNAGIKKNVTTHTLRHTCATHMLRNGAPVRHIQEMLGHESLESTQIYTRVTINDLKEIHAKYHPNK